VSPRFITKRYHISLADGERGRRNGDLTGCFDGLRPFWSTAGAIMACRFLAQASTIRGSELVARKSADAEEFFVEAGIARVAMLGAQSTVAGILTRARREPLATRLSPGTLDLDAYTKRSTAPARPGRWRGGSSRCRCSRRRYRDPGDCDAIVLPGSEAATAMARARPDDRRIVPSERRQKFRRCPLLVRGDRIAGLCCAHESACGHFRDVRRSPYSAAFEGDERT
jgi:hypothetical protein